MRSLVRGSLLLLSVTLIIISLVLFTRGPVKSNSVTLMKLYDASKFNKLQLRIDIASVFSSGFLCFELLHIISLIIEIKYFTSYRNSYLCNLAKAWTYLSFVYTLHIRTFHYIDRLSNRNIQYDKLVSIDNIIDNARYLFTMIISIHKMQSNIPKVL